MNDLLKVGPNVSNHGPSPIPNLYTPNTHRTVYDSGYKSFPTTPFNASNNSPEYIPYSRKYVNNTSYIASDFVEHHVNF